MNEIQWQASSEQLTPDLSDLVAEVIQLGGWQPGNSISFVLQQHDDIETLMGMVTTTSTR